jgi:hypothetical protein
MALAAAVKAGYRNQRYSQDLLATLKKVSLVRHWSSIAACSVFATAST